MIELIGALFSLLFMLLLLGVVLWTVYFLVKTVFGNFYSLLSPPVSREARIISRRQSSNNGRTRHSATFEFNDGSRKELLILNGDYGILKEGDRGTVSYSGHYYKGFDRNANSAAPQSSNPVGRSSVRNTQSTKKNPRQDKLRLGLQRLSKAGNDADLLGLALISLHGALEDYFRNWLSTNPSISASEREAVLDVRQTQWKGLLDLMQQYGSLNANQRRYIFRMNRLRQDVGHGSQFSGTRSELENYADFVRDFIADGSSSTNTSENQNNGSQQQGDDLRMNLRLSSHEATSGTEKQIEIPHLEKCETCNGKGSDNVGNRCSICHGDGRIQKSRKLKVTVPAGVGNGVRLRVAGEGDAGINDAAPGDLYIYLQIDEDL